MDKNELRAHYRKLRAALPPEQVAAWGAAIQVRVMGHPWVENASVVLCYVDAGQGEAPTRGLIDAFMARGAVVGVPVTGRGRELAWHRFKRWDELTPNRWGILEPKIECVRPFSGTGAETCIVPGIAFTVSGHRIGYGGGYYDRFLAEFGGRSIGLCYEALIAQAWEPEVHDVPVGRIITEVRELRTV